MRRVAISLLLGLPLLTLLGGLQTGAVPSQQAFAIAPEGLDNAARGEILKALELFNPLVGEWRGVGQPQRNSTKGSWSETSEWVWEITKTGVGVRYNVKEGKQLTTALFSYDLKAKQYTCVAKFADGSSRSYTGRVQEAKLSLESEPDAEKVVHQLVVTQLNEKRTLLLYQRRRAETDTFLRVAEVGYTRQGTTLAVEGVTGPECVVTGGKGTSTVMHKGKTYYVCCTGCRDAFNDDPETFLTEYKARLEKKKAMKN